MRILPQPLLTYAGPMPNFKKKHQNFTFFHFWVIEYPHTNKNRGNS
jgi:hypothetical protein